MVWARYAWLPVRLGHLLGVRREEVLEFRLSQPNVYGETPSGYCRSTLHVLGRRPGAPGRDRALGVPPRRGH